MWYTNGTWKLARGEIFLRSGHVQKNEPNLHGNLDETNASYICKIVMFMSWLATWSLSTAMVVDLATDARYGTCWKLQKLGKAGWSKNWWCHLVPSEHTGNFDASHCFPYFYIFLSDLSWGPYFETKVLNLCLFFLPTSGDAYSVRRGHILGTLSFLLSDLRKDVWNNRESDWRVATFISY